MVEHRPDSISGRLAIVAVVALALAPSALAQQGVRILIPVAPGEVPLAVRTLPREAGVLRERFVRIATNARQPQATRAGLPTPLLLNLFRDLEFTVRPAPARQHAIGAISWNGSIRGDATGWASFTSVDNAYAADIRYRGRFYQIRHIGEGIHAVRAMDPDYRPQRINDTKTPPPYGAARDRQPRPTDRAGTTIDVLAVYTTAAKNAAGGASGIQAQIQNAVNQTNAAFTSTGAAAALSLVVTKEVGYSQTSFNQALDDITDGSGGLEEVHQWREDYGADLVAMIVEQSGGGVIGIAWVMNSVSPGFRPYGYSVTARSWAAGPEYVLGHEIGHNIGMLHDRYSDGSSGGGAYSYSYGFVHDNAGNRFKTIMSYEDHCFKQGFDCPTIRSFSSPDSTHNGDPIGVPEGAGSADNSRTASGTAGVIAAFYSGGGGGGGGGGQVPGAPKSLAASVDGNSIFFSWAPPDSGDATGYRLEVGTSSGATNTLVKSLTGTSTTASGLSDGTYYARSRATNSHGVGAPSAEVQVTIDTSVEPPGVPSSVRLLVVGASDLLVSWDAPSDGGPPDSYRVRLSGIAARIVTDIVTTSRSHTFTDLAIGTYSIEVSASNSGGTSERTAPVATFVGMVIPDPPGPLKIREPKGALRVARPNFAWTAARRAVRYEFVLFEGNTEVYRRELLAGEVCQDRECAVGAPPEVMFKYAPTRYKIRVRGLNEGGPGPSKSTRFHITTSGVAGLAKQLRPLRNTSQSTVELQWLTDPAATVYEIEVEHDGAVEFFTRIRTANACSASGTCQLRAGGRAPGPLSDGPHSWRVRAINDNSTGEWATTVFRVQPNRLPHRPKITSPDEGDIVGEYPALQWTADEYSNVFRITLRNLGTGTTEEFWPAAIDVCRGPQDCRYVPANIGGGTYEWTITAGTSEARLGSPSPTRRFTVIPGTPEDTAPRR